MNRKPFVLIEILICVGILALCIIPIVGYPIYSFHQRKEKLINIEKERQAELIFFDFLKKTNQLSWDEINRSYSIHHNKQELPLKIDGLGEITFNTHTHLYHCHKDDSSEIRKIWFGVCFEEECNYRKGKNNPYQFVFFARKKVEEKTLNESKEE